LWKHPRGWPESSETRNQKATRGGLRELRADHLRDVPFSVTQKRPGRKFFSETVPVIARDG